MKLARFEGCWTAMITPFTRKGEVDFEGLEKNIQFQIENRAHLVPTGTTGESPTLDWKEHDRVIGRTAKLAKDRAFVMAGTGSNSTKEAIRGTKHAVEVGAQSVLMMDCYYNGPSTLELRTQYYEPIAKMFRKTFVVPYIIPGRTGTKMEVEDLAILHRHFKNVRSVKEATADLDRMAKTRSLCGEDFDILSGDDDKTFDMIARRDIRASGVISVMSNIIPGSVYEMVKAILDGNMARANELKNVLELASTPRRIECYDISHTQGVATVGSMVVFNQGVADKKLYRRFNIESTAGAPDDFASMEQVLTRRFRRWSAAQEAEPAPGAKPDESFAFLPDLLIVDGGKGQLSRAVKVLTDFELMGKVPVVGLAKQEEEIFFPEKPDSLLLPRHSQSLYLVQRIRDEAHRFAITAHRNRRVKQGMASALDSIPGIGPVKRRALIKHFGSVDRIRAASVVELTAVPGINQALAEGIKAQLE